MDRREADRAIEALGEIRDRVATLLYAIDSHSALIMLRSPGTRGRTAEIGGALAPEIEARWHEFGALGDALESARTVRAARRPGDPEWAALSRELAEQSRRAATLETACRTTTSILDDLQACTDAVTAALEPVTAGLAALRRGAADIGGPTAGASLAVTALAGRVAAATDDAYADPVGSAPGGRPSEPVRARLAAIAADLREATSRVHAVRRLRDNLPDRAAATRARLDDLERAEDAVREVFARAAEKIADAGLPDVPHTAAVLRARLADVIGRTANADVDWPGVTDALADLDSAVDRSAARATKLIDAADGLIARRDELRGRLEAYRSKAAALRLDEHEALAPLHETANTLLYTAPCDLPAATRAVRAYQEALTGLVPGGKDARR